MSSPRGIFDTFTSPSSEGAAPPASPFAVASNGAEKRPEAPVAASPFAAAPAQPQARKDSPFAIVDDNHSSEDSQPVRLPERRKTAESPFQISEPQGFGFEAQPQALKGNPFEVAKPAPAPAPQQAPSASPFAPSGNQAPAPQSNAFGSWPQADASPVPAPAPVQSPEQQQTAPAPAPVQQTAPAPQQPQAVSPQPAPAPQAASASNSDSFEIKQLELRAIFGVDREMTKDEILQRARSLPGIRQIARVSEQDISAVDALKTVISNLGFGSSPIKLYSGSVPIEFIREGRTLLAVQTDGGFAPGVRETLMIVARELGR
ncbi:hypothetical protein ACFSSA_00140 [Luteolibacter algae]|uniref:Uncharacterized protein n=1 Tax=Luteolibacter algae TaxID=454151 RepID=A0ABW5D5Z9_9BACT